MDWESRRSDFPVTEGLVYLNNAVTTPLSRPVYEAAEAFNRSHSYRGSLDWDLWAETTKRARRQFAAMIGARPEEIGFTRSTSEGMNIAAYALAPEGDVVAPLSEFPSSVLPWPHHGAKLRRVEDVGGVTRPEDIESAINGSTATIVSSHVQYCTGFRQDLRKLGQLAREYDLHLIVNTTQSVGAMVVDAADSGADIMVSNGFKWLGAGFGGGTIFVKKELIKDIVPVVRGWYGEEEPFDFCKNGERMADTATRFEHSPNFGSVAALDASLAYFMKIGMPNVQNRILELTGYLIEQLDGLGIKVVSPRPAQDRSGIVVFKADQPKQVADALKKRKVIVSARGEGIRVSPHMYNNEGDIDKLIAALKSSEMYQEVVAAQPAE